MMPTLRTYDWGMLDWIRRLRGGPATPKAPKDLLSVDRAAIGHLWHRPDGLPRVDWQLANQWVEQQKGADGQEHAWRRAVAAACLDELRDSLPSDHRRWRSANVEGLAPLEGSIGPALAAVAERSYKVLGTVL